ncbi:tRNA pseudouridine(38-40) synthase TruA [Candidatus Fermentibacteria bacterium]|nr:tRNA pseudouridine(38-40) synthase TruA [Candidatus Fermentibacteria bacterium]
MSEKLRLRMKVSYDGTDFYGWQVQAEGRTVQGEIESAMARLLGRRPRLHGSGRTDRGVHALGQVAHVDVSPRERRRIVEGLDEVLPQDVSVHSIEIAPTNFHARFSAISRTYVYRMLKAKSPLQYRYACTMEDSLVSPAMREAAKLSLGMADWRGMAKEGSSNQDWTVEVTGAWMDEYSGGWTLVISANRFLRGMVRIWAGTLMQVGRGRLEPEDMARILQSGDRSLAGPALPAKGLTLLEVRYESSEITGKAGDRKL